MEEADTGPSTDGHVRAARADSASSGDVGDDAVDDASACASGACDGDELRDPVVEAIGTLPPQPKLVFLAVLSRDRRGAAPSSTGEVYNVYERLCVDAPIDPLSQRRVTDLLEELDTFGLVSTTVVSEGRYGRTREIESAVATAPARAVVLADDSLGVDSTSHDGTE